MADLAPPPKSSSIYDQYNPQGEGGGVFAPAHIAGWQPSRDAVAAWTAQNRPITPGMIESLRMPPAAGANPAAGQSSSIAFGTQQGAIDPEALRVMAQGGKYDVQGRRDAIAAQMLANQQPAAPAAAAPASAPQMPDWYTERSLRGW